MRTDLVLRPFRTARTAHYPAKGPDRRRVVALVYMNDERGDRNGDGYAFPSVSFAYLVPDEAEPVRFGASVRFQRHDKRVRFAGEDLARYLGGFMAGHASDVRPWSHCYATEFQAGLTYHADIGRASYVLGLVDRARTASREHGPRALRNLDCHLLTLLDGLRRIGVEIRIESAVVRARRERRTRGTEYSLAV